MTNIPIYIKKGRNRNRQAGYYSTEDRTYYKDIIWSKHHFIQPKYRNFLFVSKTVIEDLEKLDCKYFKFRIIGHERMSYFIVIEMSKFIKNGHLEQMDDKQVATHISNFERIYPEQTNLKGGLK